MIYFNGDSFTYGQDLDNRHSDGFPTLISEENKIGYINDALPSSSNERIFLNTLSFLLQNLSSDVTYIIGWSYIDRRFESIYDDGSFKLVNLIPNEDHSKNTKYRNKIQKFLFNNFEGSKLNSIRLISYMISLQSLFNEHKKKYLFWSVYDDFEKIYNDCKDVDIGVGDYSDQKTSTARDVKSMWNFLDKSRIVKLNLYDFLKQRNPSDVFVEKNKHMGVRSHTLWSDYLLTYLNNVY